MPSSSSTGKILASGPRLTNSAVSLRDNGGSTAMMVSANDPLGWPQCFKVVTGGWIGTR
jgi:hypothetical protein